MPVRMTDWIVRPSLFRISRRLRCSTALQLGLLEGISRAGTDGGRRVIIMLPAEPGSSAWRWECVDALLDRR